jgi:hypothetical protein
VTLRRLGWLAGLLARAAEELRKHAAAPAQPAARSTVLRPWRGAGSAPSFWLIPPARAQALDASAVTSAISGVAGASLLGGIADSVSGTGSYEKTIDGPDGERAVIRVQADKDGTVTSSIASNADIPILAPRRMPRRHSSPRGCAPMPRAGSSL